MSDKEPSFQEFFGLTDEQKEAFEEACEIAVSSDKKLEEQNNRKITKDEDIVGLVAKQVMGVGEDSEEQPSDEFVEQNIKKIKEYSDFFNAMAVESDSNDEDK